MALNKASVAKRLTSIPRDLTATLVSVAGQGKRNAMLWEADKYGTAKVRAYLPEGIKASVLNGFVLDYNVEGVLSEDADDNTNRKEIVARSIVTFGKDGKPSGFTSQEMDDFESTALIVINIPAWAEVDTLTLAVA